MTHTAEEYLTMDEAADLLKLHRRTVTRWLLSGKLPAYKVGHQWRIRKSDLDAFIEQFSNQPTQEG